MNDEAGPQAGPVTTLTPTDCGVGSMVPDAPGSVVRIRPSAAAQRRARREFDALMTLARLELDAIAAGDLAGFWGLHRAVNTALGLVLDHCLEMA